MESGKSIYAMHASATMQIPRHQSLAEKIKKKKHWLHFKSQLGEFAYFFVQEIYRCGKSGQAEGELELSNGRRRGYGQDL